MDPKRGCRTGQGTAEKLSGKELNFMQFIKGKKLKAARSMSMDFCVGRFEENKASK